MTPLHRALLVASATVPASHEDGRVSVDLKACPKPSVSAAQDPHRGLVYCAYQGRKCPMLQLLLPPDGVCCKAADSEVREAPKQSLPEGEIMAKSIREITAKYERLLTASADETLRSSVGLESSRDQ